MHFLDRITGRGEEAASAPAVRAEEADAHAVPQTDDGAPTVQILERVGAILDFATAVEKQDPSGIYDAWDEICKRCRLQRSVRPEPPVERMLQAALHAGLEKNPAAMRAFLVHLHKDMRRRATELARKEGPGAPRREAVTPAHVISTTRVDEENAHIGDNSTRPTLDELPSLREIYGT